MDRKIRLLLLPVALLWATLSGGREPALAANSDARGAAAASSSLRFPVLDRAARPIAGPSYFADELVIRLTPEATLTASVELSNALKLATSGATGGSAPASGAIRPRLERLGLASLDRAAQSLGAWLEPEFAGAKPPREGSGRADFTSFYIVHLSPGTDLAGALDRFRALPEVSGADPIAEVPLAAVPNDSLWSVSWWLDQPSGADIHAPAAWDISTGDTSIVVAVLDSGILRAHPDLGGSTPGTFGNLWTNWAEVNGVPGVDDDGNGWADDTWGWDFQALPPIGGAPSGEDAYDEDNDPNDYFGHGTSVAGVLGALTNNTIGMSGVLWNARLMAVRVASAVNGTGTGAVSMSYAAKGIDYAVRNGASVINCSFETVSQIDFDSAIDDAIRAGVAVVVAAGNSGQSHDAADRTGVIAVGATDQNDQVSLFSNTGPFVDLSAPGNGISTTYLVHVPGDSVSLRTPAYEAGANGTSYSTPMVSGAAALIQARQRQLGFHPLTPMGVQLRLRETADDIRAQNPGMSGYGTGRLDLNRAVSEFRTSLAYRTGATTVGPAVVLPSITGRTVLAYAMSNAQLVLVSNSGDTLAQATLPGAPARQLAAADLGGSLGIGLFVGTTNGKVAGFDANGAPLSGWPRSSASTIWPMSGGPALGDLDGDGQLEVVCGSGDGSVYAWRANGTPITGFPAVLYGGSINLPVALAPLDANPGDEIVAVTDLGDVHVLDATGNDVAGWPQSVAGVPAAPLVTRLGVSPAPVVVVAAGNQVHAFDAGGTPLWTATLPGNVITDPAAADLDQDGFDEILVPTLAPSTLTVIDTAGVLRSAPGFPINLPAAPAGPVVTGPLAPLGAPGALIMVQGGLAAFDASGQALPQFPNLGGAGVAPVIGEFDWDEHTEVAAGSGPDSCVYVYDAGPGTNGQPASMWPAPRANDARTGSRIGAPGLLPRDDFPPAPVIDLQAALSAPDSVVLAWTAPGDNANTGTAAKYELRVTPNPFQAIDFSLPLTPGVPVPAVAGTSQRFAFQPNAPGTLLYFALRALDAAGNAAPHSNVPALQIPVSSGTLVTTLSAASAGDSVVKLRWQPPSATVLGYDVRGARAPLDDTSWGSAPLARVVPASTGSGDSTLFTGLEPGTTWWFGLRAMTSGGQPGPLSNVATITVPMTGWLAGRVGLAIAPHTQPSRLPVQFDWQGVPAGSQPRIELYDLAGRKVRTLALESGRYGGSVQWNGRDDQQRSVPAGLYFARLNCGSIHAQTRVVLLP